MTTSNGPEVRRLSGLRAEGSGNVDAERSGTGKVRFGTVLCDGGFRVSGSTDRKISGRKGLGLGRSGAERFGVMAAFGLLDHWIGKDRDGKVQNPDGAAPTGRWEDGFRVVGSSKWERER